MGLPWFAMISDKNIRMNLNMLEKKPLTFFLIWAFLRQQSIRNWFFICHIIGLPWFNEVRHDRREEHPHLHEAQNVEEKGWHFYQYINFASLHPVYFKKTSAAPFGNRSPQLRGAWVCTWADLQNLQGGAAPPHKTETRWTEKEKFLCLSAPLVKAPHFSRLLCWMGLARYSRNYSGCLLGIRNAFRTTLMWCRSMKSTGPLKLRIFHMQPASSTNNGSLTL